MNITNLSTPPCSMTESTSVSDNEALHIVASIGNVIIVIVGVIGNGIVIWLGGFKMKKTICMIWYLNLAVADFFFCAVRILSAVREAMNFDWPFGTIVCKVSGFMKYFNLYASVLFLMVISVDRCIMIANPIWCKIHRNMKRSIIICCVAWILATAMSLPYAVLFDTYKKERNCMCEYSPKLKKYTIHPLRISRFIFGFVIPLIIIIASNIILAIHLKAQRLKTSRNATRLLTVVVASFFVCWFPHHVLILLKETHNSKMGWKVTFKMSNLLAFFSACINPVLFFFVGYVRRYPRDQSLLQVLSRAFVEDSNCTTEPDRLQMSV
ncbi:chemerin-like receptor 1 [Ambystoma mexicanum]|uniref:chemerin-like receptor 1 n=1 Tax=Ambystoma mexicanum TaxID=8296 RepID=UPI0037E89AEE